jgi:hypothetical protein
MHEDRRKLISLILIAVSIGLFSLSLLLLFAYGLSHFGGSPSQTKVMLFFLGIGGCVLGAVGTCILGIRIRAAKGKPASEQTKGAKSLLPSLFLGFGGICFLGSAIFIGYRLMRNIVEEIQKPSSDEWLTNLVGALIFLGVGWLGQFLLRKSYRRMG